MADMGRVMLERALAVGADVPALRLDLGILSERAGQLDAAALHYRAALGGGDAGFAAADSLARVLEREGRVDEAIAMLADVRGGMPDHVPTLLALARLAYRQNRLPLAREAFEAAYAAQPAVLDCANIGYAEPVGAGVNDDPFPHLDIAPDADASDIRAVLAGADLHLFDDFLTDPDAVRAWAATLAYTERRGNYPGAQTAALRADDCLQRIADLLGRPIKWASPDNGVVRLTLGDATARTDIHVDDEQAVETSRYAAVLYLTDAAHCRGGTSFWRHRQTGWIKRLPDEAIRAAGYADFKSFLRTETPANQVKAFDALVAARSRWQRLFTLPMRYNRLVLYKGNYFHAVDSVFGQSFADGRLTRLFTFETYD
jgi:tetratricopeptide (TPR) repeat protein